jgi:hypothetical protein
MGVGMTTRLGVRHGCRRRGDPAHGGIREQMVMVNGDRDNYGRRGAPRGHGGLCRPTIHVVPGQGRCAGTATGLVGGETFSGQRTRAIPP